MKSLSSLLAVILTAGLAIAEPTPKFTAADLDFFEKRIRPVLVEHCYECHAEKKQRGGLRLDSRAATLEGGDLGPSLIVGRPEKSRLIHAVRYADEDLRMPPKKKLPDAVVNDLVEWVKRGAPWPEGSGAATAKSGEMQFTPAMKSHWAFQPVRRPKVPEPKNAA